MANGKTINTTIDEQALEKLAATLASFSAASEALRKQIITLFPAKYGSDLWWEQEEARSRQAIQEGRYTELTSKEDIRKFFNSL
ncbi:MAG: hypothetical protein AAB457_04095 [Patescibacteria group bacterium]